MKPVEEAYKLMLSEACAKGKKEGMDPIGREDGDIDNDGDKDSSDKFLKKRRDAIKQSMEEGAAAALQMATAKRRQSKSKEQNDAQDSSSDLGLQIDAYGKKPDHKVFPVDTFDQPKKMDADAKKIDGGVGAGKGKLPGDTASREPMQKVTQKEEAELDEAETTAEYLARGGKITKLPPGKNPKKNPLSKGLGNDRSARAPGQGGRGTNYTAKAGLSKLSAQSTNYIGNKHESAELDEAELLELKKSTLSSYIKKAADPLRKNSNVNLASRAANKLATSGNDMSAGEKEDNKAYTRSKGIQTAAKKLAKEEVGLEEKLETDGPKQPSLDKSFNKVPTTSASQAYSDMKAGQRRDMNKKNDPGAHNKGLALSVVDRVKAAKKAKARGIKEENGQEANQLSGLISKYNVNGTSKGGQEACDTKSVKKFDIKGFKAATQEPLEKVSEEYDDAKAAHNDGVRDATAGRPKKNASDIYAHNNGHYHAGYDSVKQKQK